MTKTYLKRIAAPKTWPLLRRTNVFITRPKPSGHPLAHTLPMVVIMREYLKMVKTARQAGRVLKANETLVNGRRVHTVMDSAGFMDIVSFGKHAYRILIDRNGMLTVTPVAKGQEFTIRRVMGKTVRKDGKVQLNLTGGMNLLADKHACKVGDGLVIKDGKITEQLPLKEGASVLVTGGSHIGAVGVIEKIEGKVITVKADNESFLTTRAYTYVIGKGTPLITIG